MSRFGQGHAPVQQRAQNIGSVDLDFGILRQLLVGPYSLGQARSGSGSLADALFSSDSRVIVSEIVEPKYR